MSDKHGALRRLRQVLISCVGCNSRNLWWKHVHKIYLSDTSREEEQVLHIKPRVLLLVVQRRVMERIRSNGHRG